MPFFYYAIKNEHPPLTLLAPFPLKLLHYLQIYNHVPLHLHYHLLHHLFLRRRIRHSCGYSRRTNIHQIPDVFDRPSRRRVLFACPYRY